MPFQAILPNVNISQADFDAGIERQMNVFMNIVHEDFQLTVRTWKSSGRMFSKTVKMGKRAARGECLTGSLRYGYVNNGTKRHWVGPVNARMLRFRSKYTPKTSPGSLGSNAGGPSGNWAYSRGHYVNGIKARNFDKEIRKLREKDFLLVMEKAFFVKD